MMDHELNSIMCNVASHNDLLTLNLFTVQSVAEPHVEHVCWKH